MNRWFLKLTLLTASLLLIGFADNQLSAQTRRGARNGADAQQRDLLQRIRVQSDNFRTTFDAAIQNVRLRGTDGNNINRDLDDYNQALSDYDAQLQSRHRRRRAPDSRRGGARQQFFALDEIGNEC